MKRYKPKRVYRAHTAKTRQRCSICTGAIEPGDIYLRRNLFKNGVLSGAIVKCDQCVTIKEINQ